MVDNECQKIGLTSPNETVPKNKKRHKINLAVSVVLC